MFGRKQAKKAKKKNVGPLPQTKIGQGRKSSLLSLEPRLMFDAAAAATAAEVNSEQVAQEQAEAAVSGDSGGETQASIDSQDLLQAFTTYMPVESRTEVVFVDPTVPNYQELLSGMDSNIEVVMLDGAQDGVEQMAAALSGRTGIDAIHVISHGDAGTLQLGTGTLTIESMSGQYADELATIQQALSGQADILVYGCDFAEGDVGQAVVNQLALLTGADIQASTDLTGNVALGGDWDFEIQTGAIETQVAVNYDTQANWVGLLSETVTVTTATDNNDSGITAGNAAHTITWLNANKGADGQISLREAMIAANNTSGTDTIAFSIAGTGVHTINVASALPTITGTVILDATTDDSFAVNSSRPAIILDGNNSFTGDGLRLSATADGSTIRGFVIRDFSGDGIEIQAGSDNNTIVGNYIGSLNGSGTSAGSGERNTQYGILVLGANNTIGGTTAADRNVISGNALSGVYLTGAGATGNTVIGNYLGTDAAGTSALGNVWDGVSIDAGAANNTVGGTVAGARNVISGNSGRGLWLDSTSGNVIQGNYIGTNAAGTAAIGNSQDGIYASASSNNTIGGTTAAERNVISGNLDGGLTIVGATSANNVIRGNYIGTAAAGNVALGNSSEGITLDGAVNTLIGGTSTGAGNVIGDNAQEGIWLINGATGTIIQGNYIGTDATGTVDLGNSSSGISIGNTGAASSGNLIGGTVAGAGNVIAFNANAGIAIDTTALGASVNNAILGNSIYSNLGPGIDLDDVYSSASSVGVTANDAGDADTGGNNRQNFPVLTSVNSNAAGTTIAGTFNSNANTTYRIEFFGSRPSVADAANGEGERFLGAITVTTDGSGNATYNTTLANIWVNSGDKISATATVDLGGGNYGSTSEFAANVTATSTGIIVVDTTSDVADGTTTSISNLGNARGADGRISLREAIAAANASANGGTPDKIVFNIAGTGTHIINVASALPTINQAVIIDGLSEPDYVAGTPVVRIDGAAAGFSGITIGAGGGGSTIQGLMITGFTVDGINVASGANNVTIADNWIGTAGTGTTGIGNSGVGNTDDGIDIAGSNASILRNVITNSGDEGITIVGSGVTAHIIQGNYIGVDPDGSTGGGNTDVGIAIISGTGNTIGGTAAGAGNVISKNYEGIEINTSNNVVQGNYIGTDITGTLNRGNRLGDGVQVQGSSTGNLIGGETLGAGNVIAWNAGDGVAVVNGTNNAIVRNSIFANTGLAIDLGPGGVTTNDSGDGDTGANSLQNFPVLSSAVTTGTQITISGTLNSAASTSYRVEFYANTTGDGTGYGEGQTLIGITDVTTDAFGNASYSPTFTASVAPGSAISATVSRLDGGDMEVETSEFALNVIATVGNAAPTITNLSGDSLSYNEGDGAVVIEQGANAVVADVDSADFNTGTLTVSFTAGSDSTEDVLSIRNQGTGAGQIGVSGSNVTYQGVTIGTFTGGSGGSNLVITLNSSADATAVTALVKNITYENTDTAAPTTGARTVRYVLTDGDGGTSANYDTTVTVGAANDAPTFGVGDGQALTSFGSGWEFGRETVIQPDGKILVGGYSDSGGSDDFSLVRYNADGTLDTSFGGGDGVAFAGIVGRAEAMVLQADGKVVLSGYTTTGGYQVCLVRFNADGTLDTSFGGGDGIASSGVSGSAKDVALQTDGKFLVAADLSNSNFNLMRFNSDGSLDTSFGGGSGYVSTDLAGSTDRADSLTIQSDGKVLLSGIGFNGTSFDVALVRYNTDGSLDTSFNGTGKVLTDFGANSSDMGNEVWMQADGKIVVAGWSDAGGTNDFAIARYNTNGTLDTGFGTGGKVTINLGGSDLAEGLTIQSDGKILVTGTAGINGGDVGLVRLNTDGTLDTTFGGGDGIVTTDYSGASDDRGYSVAVQSDGRIVVSGTTQVGVGGYNVALNRYSSTGSLDTTLDPVNTLNGTPTYTEGGSPVVLDADVQIFDAELSALNNFSGATLTLIRNGGANAEDVFSATGTLSLSSGNVIVSGTTIGTYTNSGGTLTFTFNSNATQTLVNSAMRQIAYSNSSDAPPASVQINWSFSDGNTGAQGGGGALSAIGSTTVSITAVNDAPVITNLSSDSLSYNEGDGAVVIEQGGNALVADVDSTNLDTGTLTVSFTAGSDSAEDVLSIRNQGTGAGQIGVSGANVTYQGVTIGTFTGGSSGSNLVITLNSSATPTAVTALVKNITYENTDTAAPTTGARTVRYVLTDGDGGTSANYDTTVMVSGANDAPVFTVPPGTTPYTEGAYVFVTPSATLTDVDSPDFSGGQLVLSITAGGENTDRLYVNSQGTGPGQVFASGANVSYNGGGGSIVVGTISGGYGSGDPLVITFNSNATSGAVAAITSQVLFWNTSDNPAASSRTITLQVTDGDGGTSELQTRTISVTPINDPPTITNLVGDSLAYNEGDGAVVIEQGGNALVADVDSADFNTGTLTVSFTAGSDAAEDVLSIRNQGTGAGQIGVSGSTITYGGTTIGTFTGGSSGSNLVITFNSNATPTAVTALVKNITYENTDTAAPTIGARTVRYTLTDGDGGTSANYDTTVTVSGVNDAPVLADTALSMTVAEDAGAPSGPVGSLISAFTGGITDVDSGAAKGIAITGSNETNGTWYYTTNGGTTWTAVGSVSNTSALLLADNGSTRLYFAPGADYNGTSSAALTVRAWDQTSGTAGTKVTTASNGGTTAFSTATDTVDVTVSAVNDAPIRTAGTVANLTVLEDSGFTTLGLGGVAYGPGGGADEIGQTLTYTVTAIPSSSIGNVFLADGTTQVTVGSYTLADIQGMQFKPAANASGVTAFQFNVYDSGGTANGGANTISQFILLTVTAVNDTPVVDLNAGGAGQDVTTAFTEQTPVLIAPVGTLTDVDSANLSSLTVTLTARPDGDAVESLSLNATATTAASGAGLTVSYTASTGVLSITGSATKAVYQSILQGIQYNDTSDAPTTNNRSITVVANDGAITSATQTVTVTVTAVNDPTVVTGGTSGSGTEDTVLTGTLTATDVEGLSDGTVFTVTTNATNGSASIDPATGLWSYSPNADYNGSDSFTVTITDDAGNTSTQVISVTVTPVVDLTNDSLTTNEDSAISANVLTGTNGATADSFEGTPVLTSVTQGANGSVTFLANGTVTYTPTANFTGTDSFTYSITSGGVTETATVTVTVNAVNDPTVVTGGTSGSGTEDTTLTGTLTATDAEGLSDGSVFTVSTNATNGTASIDPATGLWSYTPNADYNGSDSFTVTITDDAGNTSTQVISVTVTPVNDAPTLTVNTGSTVAEGGTDTIGSSELAVTDIEQTAAQLVYSIGTGPAYGRLELTTAPGVSTTTFTQADIAANQLVYVHDGSETTGDSFTFTVNDGAGGSIGSTTVTLTITPVNDTPNITSDGGASTAAINVVENVSAVTIVTGADVDLPAQALTYSISGGVDQALFMIDAATGALNFTAPPDFEVTADANGDNVYVVQVQVVDSQGASTTQTIQVTVADVVEGVLPIPTPPPVLLPTTPPSPTGPGLVPSRPLGPAEPPTDALPQSSVLPDSRSAPAESHPATVLPSPTERLVVIRPEEPRATIDEAKDSVLFPWIDEGRRLLLTGLLGEPTPTPESEPAEKSQSVSDLLFSKLDEMTASLEQAMGVSQEQHVITVRIAALTGATLSAGFIAWALRSGTLLASFMATMPAWRHFDPLPVLGGSRREWERRRKEAEQDQQAENTEFKGLKHLLDLGIPPDPKS